MMLRTCSVLTALAAAATLGVALAAAPQAGQSQAPPAAPAKPAPSQKNYAPLLNAPGQAWEEKYIDVPFIGKTNVYAPKQPTKNVVLFLSGDGGWELGVLDMSRRIAPKGIVIGLNFVTLRKDTSDGSQGTQGDQSSGQRELLTFDEYGADIDAWQAKKDSLSDLSEQMQMKVQMAMDSYQRAMSMLSNLMKKISDTSSGIIQNLK